MKLFLQILKHLHYDIRSRNWSYSKFRMQDFKLERVTHLIDKSEGLFASLEFIHSHIFLCKHIVYNIDIP